MPRRTLVLSALITLATAAAADARTVTYKRIVSPSKQITCYARIPQAGGGIECIAAYLPHRNELEPFYALKRRGKAGAGERGDYPGYLTKQHTLRYGDVWKRPGIRCTMRTSGLRCQNLDKRGFHIARGSSYRF